MPTLLFIHHSGLIGGAGVSLRNNLLFLSESGFRVRLYVPSDPPAYMEMIKRDCPQVGQETYGRRIGAVTYYSGGDSVFSPRFWYRLLLIVKQWRYWNRVINEEDPDVVVVNSTILCWMSLLGAVERRKSVCFIRETKQGSPRSLLNRIIHRCLERFTHVVFISRYDQQRENLQKAKTAVICNYVDSKLLDKTIGRKAAEDRLGLSHGVFRVLYVGGVSPLKGFDVAVDAVAKCKQPVELLVAGMGIEAAKAVTSKSLSRYAAEMERKLAVRQYKDRVVMIGTQTDMSACYAACDVLLFPMRSPHQARPAFEAGYFGKPAIITNFDNIQEFVLDGVNGHQVPPGDADAIAVRLDELAGNPEKTRKLGEANRQIWMKNHNEKTNQEAVRSILEELVRQ
ncbi:MAG: glycosyltransferase family 4 protein [Lentisphaeria bacterium]|nr:glycosyltransferase family 4 protein [Lentisphaeria bacterium]